MMSNVTYERLGLFQQTVIGVLANYKDGLKAQAVISEVEKKVQLTEFEKSTFQSGGRRFDKIVMFSTIELHKAGWIIKDHGVWFATELGIKALQQFTDPSDFCKESKRLYKIWKGTETSNVDEIPNFDKDIPVANVETAENQAREQIENYLHEMDPYKFQDLCVDLLSAMDYYVTWVAPKGKDGGVDIVAFTNPLGVIGSRIKVQVKNQLNKVSISVLKSFVANITENDCGIFICTGGFTDDAKQYADLISTKRIMLIDTDRLIELWVKYMSKLDEPAVEKLPLKPVYYLDLGD